MLPHLGLGFSGTSMMLDHTVSQFEHNDSPLLKWDCSASMSNHILSLTSSDQATSTMCSPNIACWLYLWFLFVSIHDAFQWTMDSCLPCGTRYTNKQANITTSFCHRAIFEMGTSDLSDWLLQFLLIQGMPSVHCKFVCNDWYFCSINDNKVSPSHGWCRELRLLSWFMQAVFVEQGELQFSFCIVPGLFLVPSLTRCTMQPFPKWGRTRNCL